MTVRLSNEVSRALKATGFTADQLLRDVLQIRPDGMQTKEGVFFPEGTAFVAWYKTRAYWGTVAVGSIDMNGEQFPSVSSAASRITGRPTNGCQPNHRAADERLGFLDVQASRQR